MPEFGLRTSLEWFVGSLGAFKTPLDGFGPDFRPRFRLPELSSGATLQLSLQLPSCPHQDSNLEPWD